MASRTMTAAVIDKAYNDKLSLYCLQLSTSVDNLRGTINKYEAYRKSKAPIDTAADKSNDNGK
jgi:hypothetical protein